MANSWWVIEADIGGGLTPTYQAVQGATKPKPSLIETASGTTVKVTGPFPTQAAAEATFPKGARTGPGTPSNTGPTNITKSLESLPGSVIPGSVTQFLGNLASGALWIRVAEGLLGIVLIAVGVARLTHAVPIATRIAGAVA